MGKDADESDDFSLDDSTEDDDEEFSDAASEDSSGDNDDDMSNMEDESDFEEGPKKKKAKKTTPASRAKTKATKTTPKATKAKVSPKSKNPAASKPNSGGSGSVGKGGNKKPSSSSGGAPATPLKAGDAAAAVLDYMRKTNRPYSMLNVFENMHRAVAKPALTKILDDWVDKEELVSKTYGKAKIYYMNQNKLPLPSQEEQLQITERMKTVEAECIALEQELKAAEMTLAGINSQMSDADLDATLKELEEEAKTLQTKLESLMQPGRKPVSPGRKDALKRKFNTYRSAWVMRKRIVVDAVNQIADGMEKKPSVVHDLCGIETDADVGVKEIPSI